jgi:L-threonylcarbamoyladenylate synthase
VGAPAEPFADAVRHVRAGGLVAFPTETVWGLGADASRDDAVAGLRAWKGRDDGQPISVLVEGTASLAALGFDPPPVALALAEAFWPGPLTLVLPAPARPLARGIARAEDGAVGLRCSPHPTARGLAAALARAGAGPLTATSLNRSGAPPVRTLADAHALCRDAPEVRCVEPVPGEAAPPGDAAPSTVVDCTGPTLRVLRAGAVPADALAAAATPESPRRSDNAPIHREACR